MLVVPLLAGPALAAPIPVSSCGQVLSGVGVLAGDLDCTGMPGPALTLADRSRLDMGPYTVSGGDGDGILCEGYCRVMSSDTTTGGTVSGFVGDGIVARSPVADTAQVHVNRITVRDNGGHGVRVDEPTGAITVSKSNLLGNGATGVSSPLKLRVGRSTVSGNTLAGVYGPRVKVTDCKIEDNQVGVHAPLYLNIDHSDINGNAGDGIRVGSSMRAYYVYVLGNGGSGIVFEAIGGHARMQFAEVSDNALDGIRVEGSQKERLKMRLIFVRRNGRDGVSVNHALFNQSRIDDNGRHGLYSAAGGPPCRIGIDRYSLVGNGTDPDCGVTETCADIASCAPPLNMHAATECDTSYDTASGFPGASWGICRED